MTQDQIAQTKEEWWELMRKKLSAFNSGKHSDDVLTLLDFVGEFSGERVFGWVPFRNSRGDWDIKNSVVGYGYDEENDEDDFDDEEDYFTNESKGDSRFVDEEDD